jgi:DNA-binding transcriptional MerR regulator
MDHTYLTIGAFAAQAGVSVRTLQYYDRIGLLKPSARSEGGRRLYTPHDFPRLQQIVTFKLIGLSLDQIRNLLATDTAGIQKILQQQRQALAARRAQLDAIIRALDAAQQAAEPAGEIARDKFVDIIREVVMSTDTAWLARFLTADQQEQIHRNRAGMRLSAQRGEGLAWKQLFDDIRVYLAGEPDDERARALAARWQEALQTTYAQGDRALQANLTAAYAQLADRADVTAEARAWLDSVRAAAIFAQSGA